MHAPVLASQIMALEGLRYGFASALSATLWLALVVLVWEARRSRLEGAATVVAPLAAVALVLPWFFVGGLLADRVLGYRKSITMGGIMMGVGYCLMSVHSLPMLYLSMSLVILGNGFFKPNISTLLGNLYNNEEFKDKKDEGYNIFYMGINIGAFVCNFFGAALYNMIGWGAAFIAAGIGMFIGIIIF
ncbi:MAG: MFS transporter, partial [Betaproteobacteria bacterium]|nr:MFS transporter [Betaproteobacteria bacterium]